MATKNTFTPKQALFVEEFLVDLNATQAAIRAGYSEKIAAKQGYENLMKPEIAKAVQAAMKDRSERTQVDQDFVISGLRENYERAMQIAEGSDRGGNPTGEFSWNGPVANRALELLGKHLGMFTDNLNHTGGLTITHEDALREIE